MRICERGEEIEKRPMPISPISFLLETQEHALSRDQPGCPSVDLHIITPSPRLLDRLYLGEVLNLSSHILPYHQGERLRRFQ